MRAPWHPLRLRTFAIVVPLTVAAAGCGPNTDAYVALQNTIKSETTTKDHRPVESVSCTPHVHDTSRGETAHLRCFVLFKDGSSYTANAIIKNRNSGGSHNIADSYSWDGPLVLKAADVEKQITSEINSQPAKGGSKHTFSVKCPGDLKAEAKASMQCMGTGDDGGKVELKVTVNSVSGDTVDWGWVKGKVR